MSPVTNTQQIKIFTDKAFPGFRIGWIGHRKSKIYTRILSSLVNAPVPDKTKQDDQGNQVLGGRSPIKIFQFPGHDPMVLKQYLRGGMLRFFIRDRYFRFFGAGRAHRELIMLRRAQDLGINVPAPIGFLEQGRFFYRCRLITKLVPRADTLAALCVKDEKKARQVMPQVMEQIELLIRHGMVHADLHPGNVLVNPDGTPSQDSCVKIIDFDKACVKKISAESLFKKYENRWNRAVVKHGLPSVLSQLFIRPSPDNMF